jgi:hypothetical protein
LGSSGYGLHIKGATNKDGTLKLDSTTANYSGVLQFTENGTDQWRISYDGTNNHLEFTESGVADRMVIQDGGNVGIGTSSPTHTLHVNNSIRASSSLVSIDPTGSASAPALIFGGDDDSGLWRPASNTLAISTAGAERMRIDSSGQVGIGTSASSSSSNVKLLMSGSSGAFTQYSHNGGAGSVVGTPDASTLAFYTYTGNIGAETYTERMRIDSSGNVGIGTSSPAKALDVEGAIRSNITGGTSPAEIDISSGSTWRLRSNATSGTNAYGMDIVKGSAGTDVKLSVDSSGNLLVGKTSLGISNAGHTLAADGYTEFTRTATSTSTGGTINVGRNSYDGPLATFWKDGTTVGSIGTQGSRLSIGSGDVNLNFNASANSMYPISDPAAGTLSSGIVDLGAALATFKDAYLSGGVYLGGTGSANKLEDYEEGTWTLGLGGVGASLLSSGTSVHNVYTKIGRVVHLDGYLVFTSNSSEANVMQITGLPFTVKLNTYSSGSQINQNGSGASMTPFAVSGTEYLNLYTNDNNSSQGFNSIQYSEVGQMAMHFSITYITDQ